MDYDDVVKIEAHNFRSLVFEALVESNNKIEEQKLIIQTLLEKINILEKINNNKKIIVL